MDLMCVSAGLLRKHRYFCLFQCDRNVLRAAKEEVRIFWIKVDGCYVFTLIYSFLGIVSLE